MRVASLSWLCDHLHVETRGVIRSGTGALVVLGPDDLTLKESMGFIFLLLLRHKLQTWHITIPK